MKTKQKLTTNEFVRRARIKHENKYDYSQTEYFGKFKKVKIVCPIHGEFEQEAWSHLKGRGCIKCSGFEPLTTDLFIEKSKKIHGDKYNYSKTIYISRRKSVIIICPIHGEFSQTADGHLAGKGCKKCAGFGKTKEEYIKEANLVHGNKYDYSQMKYSSAIRRIEVNCKKHGVFTVSKNHHLINKHGCPICSEPKGEKEVRLFLEKNNINFIPQKTFSGCKDKQMLQFDFYIPELNMCIEYDGIQHFKSVEYFGGRKELIKNKKHDRIKNEFCLKENIVLNRITYLENIQKRLLEIFPSFLNNSLYNCKTN